MPDLRPVVSHIAEHIRQVAGHPFDPAPPRQVGGGCINTAITLRDRARARAYFVKLNRAGLLPMFEAEAAGLKELAGSATLRVPIPLCAGVAGAQAYLVLEHLDLGGRAASGPIQAGRLLAAMHRATRAEFGWVRDNTIGATPQPNTSDPDWPRFWARQRLGFQLALAARNGHKTLQHPGEVLLGWLPDLLDHTPAPSLLHGDLWGGNLNYTQDGEPVVYDPAVYYGDREADLAMTELFGGFGDEFYAAYREAWPLDPGYATRRDLYNLYHILNHLNLFGSGYLGQAMDVIGRLLAQVR
jgi:protein-ribulosamine 3-kinase